MRCTLCRDTEFHDVCDLKIKIHLILIIIIISSAVRNSVLFKHYKLQSCLFLYIHREYYLRTYLPYLQVFKVWRVIKQIPGNGGYFVAVQPSR